MPLAFINNQLVFIEGKIGLEHCCCVNECPYRWEFRACMPKPANVPLTVVLCSSTPEPTPGAPILGPDFPIYLIVDGVQWCYLYVGQTGQPPTPNVTLPGTNALPGYCGFCQTYGCGGCLAGTFPWSGVLSIGGVKDGWEPGLPWIDYCDGRLQVAQLLNGSFQVERQFVESTNPSKCVFWGNCIPVPMCQTRIPGAPSFSNPCDRYVWYRPIVSFFGQSASAGFEAITGLTNPTPPARCSIYTMPASVAGLYMNSVDPFTFCETGVIHFSTAAGNGSGPGFCAELSDSADPTQSDSFATFVAG